MNLQVFDSLEQKIQFWSNIIINSTKMFAGVSERKTIHASNRPKRNFSQIELENLEQYQAFGILEKNMTENIRQKKGKRIHT